MPRRPTRLKPRQQFRARAQSGILATLAMCTIALLLGACGAATSPDQPTDQPTTSTIPGSQSGLRLPPIIYRPSWLSRASKAPLVIALHGGGTPGAGPQSMEGLTHFEALANQKGFVVAYLDSSSQTNPWNPRTNDLAYVSSMIDQLKVSQNVDPNRVYITGFSAGGNETWLAGCELSNKVAAIAVVAYDMRKALYDSCQITRPVPELLMIGDQDGIRFTGLPGRVISAYQATARWRALDGCAAAPVQTQQVSAVLQQTWTACTDGSAVGLYVIHGGGHDWPPYGDGSPTNYSASAAIWAFFSAHRASPTSLSGDAKLNSVRVVRTGRKRAVVSSFRFGELVGVQETLLAGHRSVASSTTHASKGTFKLTLAVRSQVNSGHYSLQMVLLDTYGRRLTMSRTIHLPKLPKPPTHRPKSPHR